MPLWPGGNPPLWILASTHVATFVLGVAAATGVARRGDGIPPSSSASVKKDDVDAGMIGMMPTLPVRVFRPNDDFAIAFDTRTKNPSFVVERLVSDNNASSSGVESATSVPQNNSKQSHHFREERSLPPSHRSRNSHYRRSGYDRGHLAAAANFDVGERRSGSYVLTNTSPQLPGFNRGVWLRLEELVRRVHDDESGVGGKSASGGRVETWVVTGPLWLPSETAATPSGGEGFRYDFLGIGSPPSVVAVPTHFFKVVAVVKRGHDPNGKKRERDSVTLEKFAAFVLPNSDDIAASNKKKIICLADFLVRISDLEAVSGLEFFPALLGSHGDSGSVAEGLGEGDAVPLRKEIADALTDDVRSRAAKNDDRGGDGTSLIMTGQVGGLSKARRRKLKQLLSGSSPVPFRHICNDNDACFKVVKKC